MKYPKSLEYQRILDKLAEKTLSDTGFQAAKELSPESTYEAAKTCMQRTKEAETILMQRAKQPLIPFSGIDAEIKRMKIGAALSCAEILKVAGVMKAAKAAAALSSNETAGFIADIAQSLFYDPAVLRKVEECITPDGVLVDSASAELSRIRRAVRTENERVRDKLQNLIRSSENAKYLQDAIITQRSGRYVIPVKTESKGNIPGIVHEKSASGATLFIEPAAVVEANNRIRELQNEESAEVKRILASLTGMFASYIDELRVNQDVLTTLDLLFAKASLGLEMGAVPVDFVKDPRIVLKEARHPLIDAQKVVPVTLIMEAGVRALVITGPNTGGKTVTLKLVGLFALMAQSGLYVPAKSPAKLPVFDRVFADIGDEQSIEQSLSTFSAHMKNIVYALRHARPRSLILLDELGAGTDPQEGSAIARAVLYEFNQKGCMIIATTHIGELKLFAEETEGFENAGMEFNAATLTPTYRLVMGVAGQSNAITISKKIGMPKQVVDRAVGFMSSEQIEYDELIRNAERAKESAEKMYRDAKEMLSQAKERRKKEDEESKKAAAKRKKKLERANEQAIEILKDAKDTAEELISETRKLHSQSESQQTKTVKKVRDKFTKKRSIIENRAASAKKFKTLESDEIKPGDTVFIPAMQINATVLTQPDQKGMVRVQAGAMTVELKLSEITASSSEKQTADRPDGGVRFTGVSSVPGEIDLHGMAVDDAQIELDRYLDDAFLAGYKRVAIIHGRGTGALRNGVWDYLRSHPHAAKHRLGNYDEGGIGVTIVTLK